MHDHGWSPKGMYHQKKVTDERASQYDALHRAIDWCMQKSAVIRFDRNLTEHGSQGVFVGVGSRCATGWSLVEVVERLKTTEANGKNSVKVEIVADTAQAYDNIKKVRHEAEEAIVAVENLHSLSRVWWYEFKHNGVVGGIDAGSVEYIWKSAYGWIFRVRGETTDRLLNDKDGEALHEIVKVYNHAKSD